jgi:tRNA-dihydrouridine synthase 2
VAGPVVRNSGHGWRMTCLYYGASASFTEGLTDLAVTKAVREEDGDHKSLVMESHGHRKIRLRTCSDEMDRLVIQLVSNSGPAAQRAMEMIADLGAGFDLNCGCPEQWATHRKCGAAVDVADAVDVVSAMRRVTRKPISVRMRVTFGGGDDEGLALGVVRAGARGVVSPRSAERPETQRNG